MEIVDYLKNTILWPIKQYIFNKRMEELTKDPVSVTKKYYYKQTGKLLDLDNPQNLNEKIQWLKLYSDTSMWTTLSDKIAVRNYIKEKGLEDILVPIYGIWENPKDIDFEKLPQQFVLKSNHGSGTVIVVKDKNKFDKNTAIKKMKNWLKNRYGAFSAELHYLGIEPKIYAEAFLEEDANISSTAIDYKIFCQNGEPSCVWICRNRCAKSVDVSIYDTDWNFHPEWSGNSNHYFLVKTPIERPPHFDRMLDIAKILSKDFPQVRVDLYNIKGKIYFGELTFTSCGGTMDFFTDDYLLELGSRVHLNKNSNI